MVSQEQFSTKIMLVRIQQESLKTSYVIFRLFYGHPAPPICPMWAHLTQDNIRYPINSMPDRVAACVAAGGGPRRC
ncbi:hypothetical protein TNCV_4308551 [Trichonephila clavipes]|nr:hypothetical protein TNCV_4308551 [Trichonephila clavipes]